MTSPFMNPWTPGGTSGMKMVATDSISLLEIEPMMPQLIKSIGNIVIMDMNLELLFY